MKLKWKQVKNVFHVESWRSQCSKVFLRQQDLASKNKIKITKYSSILPFENILSVYLKIFYWD